MCVTVLVFYIMAYSLVSVFVRVRTESAEGTCSPIRTMMPTNQSFHELNHYPKTIHGLTHDSSCICSSE